MSWSIPQAVGGPVLWWELVRRKPRTFLSPLPFIYAAWLLIQLVHVADGVPQPLLPPDPDPWRTPFSAAQRHYLDSIAFWKDYLSLLLHQQLLLLLLIIPAFVAGALAHEKKQGVLVALFCTELTPRQILAGKLLGPQVVLGHAALIALPPLVLLAVLSEVGIGRLLLALAQAVVLSFALASACLLCAVWFRQANDAMISCYAAIGAVLVGKLAFFDTFLVPDWLNPVVNLHNLLTSHGQDWQMLFGVHLTAFAGVGAACFSLGVAILRPVCLGELERRPGRRLWAFRPPVGDDSIRWREQHVIGLAPLPLLRVVPRWLALSGVFAFSAFLCYLGIDDISPHFFASVLEGTGRNALDDLRLEAHRIEEFVPLLGVFFVLLTSLLLGVRCGRSVAEEKARQTWDDLILTPQSFKEITTSKMWGVLGALGPYVVAYSLPMYAFAALGGTEVLTLAVYWVGIPCAIVFVAAWLGLPMLRVPAERAERPNASRPDGSNLFL